MTGVDADLATLRGTIGMWRYKREGDWDERVEAGHEALHRVEAELARLEARATQAEADLAGWRASYDELDALAVHLREERHTLRRENERLKRDPKTHPFSTGMDFLARAQNAEAEAARLREQRDAARAFNEPGVGEVDQSDEIRRLRSTLDDKHGMMRAAIEDAEAAEARCARLQQALRRIELWPVDVGHTPERDLLDVKDAAREALAGPDTPADSQEDKT